MNANMGGHYRQKSADGGQNFIIQTNSFLQLKYFC